MDTIPKMEKGSKAVRKAKSNYSSLQKKELICFATVYLWGINDWGRDLYLG